MRKLLLAGMVSVCLLASQVQATIIIRDIISIEISESNPFPFTLLSGQRLFTGKGVEVFGLVGAFGDVRLGRDTLIDSDVYTNGRFKAAPLSRVTGRLIAGDDIKIAPRVKMGMIDGDSNARIGKQAIIFGDIAIANDLRLHPQAITMGSILTGTQLNDLWGTTSLPPSLLTSDSFLPKNFQNTL